MLKRLIDYRRRLAWPHLVNAVGAAILIFVASHTTLIRNAEFNTVDTRFKMRGPIEGPTQTVIVGIDQQSYDDLAQTFPWPRAYFAKLLENLTLAGARVVVFDLIFDAPGDDPEGDARFAAAIAAHGRVVLGVKQEVLRGAATGTRRTWPLPALREAAAGLGLVDQLEDSDGFTRRYRLSFPSGEENLYSLGVEAIRLFHSVNEDFIVVEDSGFMEIGPCWVRKTDATSFLIDYRGGPGAIPTYSFSSVIDDAEFDLPAGMDVDAFEFQQEVFADKIVVVGATLPELQDFVRTPFFETFGQRALTPGAEMHANAIESVLSGRHYARQPHWREGAVLLLCALLVSIVAVRFRAFAGLLVTAGLGILYVLVSLWVFLDFRLILDVVSPIGSMLACHGANTLYFFVKERRERERIKGMFAKYVPEKVVNALIADPDLMNLGGEERELSILFSDLAGFTRASERLTPTELVTLLNEYLSEMTDIVLANDGIIDKYEGDLIMAEFGAPLSDPAHAVKGCRAALAMQTRLAELREMWKEQGRQPLYARIGLNTGRVVLGNMGSRAVHDYTVLGDAVNLASRLEGANKAYGTSIMISEGTLAQVKDAVVARELDRIRVVGKAKAVTVFELVAMRDAGEDAARDRLLADYAAGLAAYRERRWGDAVELFTAAQEHVDVDVPSQIFLARAQDYLALPPGEDWDGVYEMAGK